MATSRMEQESFYTISTLCSLSTIVPQKVVGKLEDMKYKQFSFPVTPFAREGKRIKNILTH